MVCVRTYVWGQKRTGRCNSAVLYGLKLCILMKHGIVGIGTVVHFRVRPFLQEEDEVANSHTSVNARTAYPLREAVCCLC